MSAARPGLTLGMPGSFPLPNAAAPGTTFSSNSKLHPAALAAGPKNNPMNAGRPAMLGGKK